MPRSWRQPATNVISRREGGYMAVSRFLVGGLASALLLTGGVFIWKGYSQVAEEAVLPDPPPALPAIPVGGARAPKRGAAPPARSEEARRGKAWVHTCRSWWSPTN